MPAYTANREELVRPHSLSVRLIVNVYFVFMSRQVLAYNIIFQYHETDVFRLFVCQSSRVPFVISVESRHQYRTNSFLQFRPSCTLSSRSSCFETPTSSCQSLNLCSATPTSSCQYLHLCNATPTSSCQSCKFPEGRAKTVRDRHFYTELKTCPSVSKKTLYLTLKWHFF